MKKPTINSMNLVDKQTASPKVLTLLLNGFFGINLSTDKGPYAKLATH